ncbi:MAG: hypothetical protein ACE5GN_06255, partial [Waddliaceae bacterium]
DSRTGRFCGPLQILKKTLASRFGVAAINLVAKKHFGEMVCLHGSEVKSISLSKVVHKLKTVPPDGTLVKTAEALGISFGR